MKIAVRARYRCVRAERAREERDMARKMFVLVMLSFSLAIGGFWALRAQDPAQPTPKPEPQTPAATTQMTQTTQTPQSTQMDLSGTYAGVFNCDAAGLTGATTMTINGNEFTTADGKSGRIVASRTKGYTAAALQVTGASSPVISLRVRKSGNKLTLSPVAGAAQQCSFTTGGKMAKGTTATPATPAATGTEVSNPAATQTPSPSPEASPTPSPEASPTPSPEASPTPSGSPRPRPRPSPGASPSPTEPMPSPTPSPSPSPRPV